jgi:hypothetical protein
MTSMWKRGPQCQYPGTVIAATRFSNDHLGVRLSSTGSPP